MLPTNSGMNLHCRLILSLRMMTRLTTPHFTPSICSHLTMIVLDLPTYVLCIAASRLHNAYDRLLLDRCKFSFPTPVELTTPWRWVEWAQRLYSLYKRRLTWIFFLEGRYFFLIVEDIGSDWLFWGLHALAISFFLPLGSPLVEPVLLSVALVDRNTVLAERVEVVGHH